MAGKTLAFTFLGEDKNLGKTMKGLGKETGKLHASWGKLAGAFAGAAVGVKAVSFLKDSVAEAQEARKVSALTAQVVKTTGGAAKITASQVGDLAEAISNKTGIDDEAIQSASNLLLTFTNLRNEVGKGNDIFNQATQIATDMGVALGNDPKAAAIQLGKALNDPIKGVTALSKVGVSFTAQQKKQITTLVKHGKTLEAQKIILEELGKEFGGAAQAAVTPSQRLSVAVGNLKEKVGTALLPVIDRAAGVLTDRVVPAISGFVDGMQDGTGAGGDFADVVGELGGAAETAWHAAKPLFSFIGDHPKLFAGVAVGAASLAASVKLISGAKGAVGVLQGLSGGKLGGVVSKAKPIPVFVTNPGFAGPPGGKGVPPAVAGKPSLAKKLPVLPVGGAVVGSILLTSGDSPGVLKAGDLQKRLAQALADEGGAKASPEIMALYKKAIDPGYNEQGTRTSTAVNMKAATEFLAKYGQAAAQARAKLLQQERMEDPKYAAVAAARGKKMGEALVRNITPGAQLTGQALSKNIKTPIAQANTTAGLLLGTILKIPPVKPITFKVTTHIDAIGRRIITAGGGTSYVQGRGGKLGLDIEGAGATGAIVRRPTVALIGENGPEKLTPLNRTAGNSPLPEGGGGLHLHFSNVYGGPAGIKELGRLIRAELADFTRNGGNLGIA